MREFTDYKIEFADIDDVPAINDIVNHYIRTSGANWAWSERSIEDANTWYNKHNMEYHPIFVAKDSAGHILGYSSLSKFRGKEGYQYVAENSVYVHPDAVGYGIGAKLMDAIIEHAKGSKIRTITAWIDSENTNSIRFHIKYNFVFSGELKDIGSKFDTIRSVTIMQLDTN